MDSLTVCGPSRAIRLNRPTLWDAVVTGDYTDGRMVLEYHSPTLGQCHLVGTVADHLYMAEHRCAADWSAADTLQLAWVPSVCPHGSEVWSGLSVCDEHDRDGYDRDAFGTGYRSPRLIHECSPCGVR